MSANFLELAQKRQEEIDKLRDFADLMDERVAYLDYIDKLIPKDEEPPEPMHYTADTEDAEKWRRVAHHFADGGVVEQYTIEEPIQTPMAKPPVVKPAATPAVATPKLPAITQPVAPIQPPQLAIQTPPTGQEVHGPPVETPPLPPIEKSPESVPAEPKTPEPVKVKKELPLKSKAPLHTANGISDSDVEKAVDLLLPKTHQATGGDLAEMHQTLVSMAGVPDNAKATITRVGQYKKLYSDDRKLDAVGIRLKIDHPFTEEWSRFVGVDNKGKRLVRNEVIKIKPQFQEQARKEDFVPKNFVMQVEHAAAEDYDHLVTHAAGKFGSPFNGYYTWLRYGYNQSIVSLQRNAHGRKTAEMILKIFPQAKSLLDIMDTEEAPLSQAQIAHAAGFLNQLDAKLKRPPKNRQKISGPEWWQVYGMDLHNAVFNLKEGSRSRQVLDDYLAAKKR